MSNFIYRLSFIFQHIAAQRKEEDIAYDNAPEDYLDPITDTLMTDPVMLPSSRKIVDRTTIARHLLRFETKICGFFYIHVKSGSTRSFNYSTEERGGTTDGTLERSQ
jgi:hypothetical protein